MKFLVVVEYDIYHNFVLFQISIWDRGQTGAGVTQEHSCPVIEIAFGWWGIVAGNGMKLLANFLDFNTDLFANMVSRITLKKTLGTNAYQFYVQ